MGPHMVRVGMAIAAVIPVLGLTAWGGARNAALAEPLPAPSSEWAIASASVAVEHGLEALLREQAIPLSMFPEIHTSFPDTVPPPIVGGLNAEIE